MKLKSWHLYAIATLCFAMTFAFLNLKYDRFYRVNGINNDNRSLIELYLDDEEQEYLIDHGISVNKFIDYITYDHFKLQNYSYYNALKVAKNYKDYNQLIEDVNSIVDRLSVEFGNSMDKQFNVLIKNDLVYAFMNSTYFDFSNVAYYQLARTLYNENDYNYIPLTNTYVALLEDYNVEKPYQTFKSLVKNYNAQGLDILLNTPIEEGVERMYDFDEMTQVINQNTFIANYQPKELSMLQSINRLHYTMYLETNAYQALKEMYDALYAELGKHFVVTEAYMPYDVLSVNQQNAGYNEYQLGTLVDLRASGVTQYEFHTTDVYQWILQHGHEYGFIQRYPDDKVEITGHQSNYTFRYVGKEAAKEIYEKQICLEEYEERE